MSVVPPEDYTEDTVVWPVMEALRQCLCDTLTERGLMPGACFCGMAPGAEVSWDYSSGLAWVRLDTIVPLTETANTGCQPPLEATFDIGVLHCAPKMSAKGTPPDEAAQREATRLQLATMSAISYAITCCYPGDGLSLGTYTPLGPQDLVGGAWSVSYGGY
jgi:hypothetical protein